MTRNHNPLMLRGGGLQASQLDYLLIDGSGSMLDKWHDTMASIDGFCDVLRAQGVMSHGIVHVFDTHNIDDLQYDCPIADWPHFSQSPLSAGFSSTPLYDAINLMGRRLRDLMPSRASIVIVTDGHETSSRHTTDAQARAILDWCRAQGWQVTFLGADFNNSRQAALLGSDATNSIGVQKALMHEAGALLGKKRVDNARFGKDINFTDDEKTDFGGYLSDHSNGGK